MKNNNVDTAAFLNPEEQATLREIARETLEYFVGQGEMLDLQGYRLSDNLQADGAAFVTLRYQDALRGCIGHTRFLQPLVHSVRENTVNAAARDPRFGPLTAQEVSGTRIEISVLCPGESPDTPFIEVHDPNEIVIGRDGLYLAGAGPRGGGLLLPQVPVEQGWDQQQFLEALCRKAGAVGHAWEQPESKLFRFSVQVIREEA